MNDLLHGKVYADSVAALTRADVIVVCLYEAERMPSIFYLWVNVWLQERSRFPGVVVATVVASEEMGPFTNETWRFVHAIASQGRLNLSIQDYNQPLQPVLGPKDGPARLAEAA